MNIPLIWVLGEIFFIKVSLKCCYQFAYYCCSYMQTHERLFETNNVQTVQLTTMNSFLLCHSRCADCAKLDLRILRFLRSNFKCALFTIQLGDSL